MNSRRLFRKTGGIVLSALGLSAVLTACGKEKTCTCGYTYSYDGQTYSYQNAFEVTTKAKCEDLEFDTDSDFADGPVDVKCEEK